MRILKKTIIFVITAVLLIQLAGIATVGAVDFDGDFDWVELSPGFVAITNYTGGGGAVGIPPILSDRIVTQINTDAFKNAKTTLTSVSIPPSVTTLGLNLFKECTALSSVTFDIGSSITSIPEGAFYGCTALTSIKIPASVTSIGKDAFKGCTSLTSITFETGSLTAIGEGAFYGSKLASVRIPASVTEIGKNAFYDCTSLTSATFAGAETIGEGAFHNTGLTSVNIPETVTSIGAEAFSACTSLKKAIVYTDDAVIGTNAFKPANGFVVYGPNGSTIDTYCGSYDPHIMFSSLSTAVGPTTITSAVSSGPTKISLTWSAAERAEKYELWRATTSGGTYTCIAPALTATSYMDTSGLVMKQAYFYKVVGYCELVGSKYYGEYSGIVSVTPLPVAPQSVSAVSAGYSSIKVSWTPVTGMNGYEIWRAYDKADGTYSLVKTWTEAPVTPTSVTAKTYTFTGLTTGRTYYYKVRGYQQAPPPTGTTTNTNPKNYGSFSGVTYAKPMPSAVTNLKAEILSPTSIKLTWNTVAGRTKYEIWRQGPGETQPSLYSTTYYNYYTNDRNVSVNQAYSYYVCAYRSTTSYGKCYGGNSNTVIATPVVKQVTGVVAARVSSTQIKISWLGLTGVDGYQLYWSTSQTAPDSEWHVISPGLTKYFYHSSLTTSTMYFYKVRAFEYSPIAPGGVAYGPWSEIKYATP